MNTIVTDHRDTAPEYQKHRAGLAMTISLTSFAMLFATLMMGYVIFRFQTPIWPPMGLERISLTFPLISTLIIALSSLTLWKAQEAFRFNVHSKFKLNVYATIFFGLGFLVAQAYLWSQMNSSGLTVDTGIFASILHGFTWIHAAHVVLGIFGLLLLLPLVFSQDKFQNSLSRVTNVAKFWHFLGIVWLVMLFSLFVF